MHRVAATFFLLLHLGASAQDNKINWYDAVVVADRTYGNLRPRIVLDQKYNPLVLWSDVTGRAFIARWKGKEFGEPVQINPPGKYVFSESWTGPEIASIGDTIYVVYKQLPQEREHIYMKHSYDGGKNFSVETQVDDSDGVSLFPSVAINPYGNPIVAYMKMDSGYGNPRFVVTKSVDLGESFAEETTVPDFSGGKVSECCPATVMESGNATVMLYRDDLNLTRNIWAALSGDTRLFFNRGLQVDSTNWQARDCPAHPPTGIIVADTLYSVYVSQPGDTSLVYLSKASLSGQSVSYAAITGAFTGLAAQNFPRIANSGDAAAVVWQQTLGTVTQVCMKFTQEIANGFPGQYEKIGTGLLSDADVVLGGGHAYVVWQDDSSGSVICRIGRYSETLVNKLLSENTTVYLQPSKSGKYFSVSMPDISSCMMVDTAGKEYEMDLKCKKGSCRVYTDELDAGLYVVKIYGKDDKIYTYKYIVKPEEEK